MELRELSLPEHPELHEAVHDMLERAHHEDGVEPLSEQYLRGILEASLGHRHILALEQGQPVGILAMQEQAELCVHPACRRHGIGSSLLRAGRDAGIKDFWAHGNLVPAQHLAASEHLDASRELLVMSVEGEALERAACTSVPDGFRTTNLEQSELVEPLQEWLRVNNEAFSWHPEQGGWDMQQLDQARQAQWYRADDVLFLEKQGALAGFHWVKRHGDLSKGAIGEVYVVGLADAFRGQGLGGPLLNLGLQRLYEQGARKVILYVEADNKPAVAVYERLGFEVQERHVVYSAERAENF
ncbi:mycothiol synthase [Corynebacterium gerontici]|uniref:Mycothiol acetyltransferase n=1 Tax=Corynebacterium gerontici TaxID=2079234 RepID=A0A3G6IY88_9CORY|nr:mycothiol synthase [Corynebacterium gerontici]AZA10745.1 Mycothiol acetyltransferase [Corynebacterium gerontici]